MALAPRAAPRRLEECSMSFLLPELVPPTLEELAPKPEEDATLKQRELALKLSVRVLWDCNFLPRECVGNTFEPV